MTKLMEKAIDSVRGLTATEQDAIAQMMLDEIESERQWEQRFAAHQPELQKLAEKAMAEYEAGKAQKLDSDKL